MIEVSGLCKQYQVGKGQVAALHDVNLKVGHAGRHRANSDWPIPCRPRHALCLMPCGPGAPTLPENVTVPVGAFTSSVRLFAAASASSAPANVMPPALELSAV